MSNAYELLLRTLVAMGEKVEDYAEHMEEVATGCRGATGGHANDLCGEGVAAGGMISATCHG
jgi:hypothetical protein